MPTPRLTKMSKWAFLVYSSFCDCESWLRGSQCDAAQLQSAYVGRDEGEEVSS
jgi:hypothetical protein